MVQDWITFAPHSTLNGSEYGERINAAHLAADRLGLTSYWHGIYVALATCDSAKLKQEWAYIYRVSDHDNPAFKELEQLKNRRKQELENATR